jgi:hypothetical protein
VKITSAQFLRRAIRKSILIGTLMIRTAAVALAALAAIDFLMFGGAYAHLLEQVASAFFNQAL